MNYEWSAALAVFGLVAVFTKIGYFLVFKVPAFQQMRALNKEWDKPKIAQEKYQSPMKWTRQLGMYTNLFFFVAILPFFVTLQAQPVWQVIWHSFLIMMVYDFFYYLTHRFLFHGNAYFRKVHGLHHQATKPSYIDAFFVHPLETFIGISLFMACVVGVAVWYGDLQVATLVIVFLIFTQLNTVNHTHIELPYFPYKTLNWITAKHAVHHENMRKGNYASITLLFDKMFGTLD